MILPLEKQVCSLELAMELKSLGVRQESVFCWFQYEGGEPYLTWNSKFDDQEMEVSKWQAYPNCNPTSAFTSAELGVYLGKFISDISYSEHYKDFGVFLDIGKAVRADTEVNARTKKLIFLLKEGIVKI